MTELAAYGGLFLAAFLAATIVPAQSAVVLGGLLLTGRYEPWLLVLVASGGSTLGAVVNWCLGRWIEKFRDRKWFPVKADKLEKVQGWYQHYGRWVLLFSWVPIVGDALTVVAGVLKERFIIFLFIVALGKTARYMVFTYMVLKFSSQ